MLTIPAPNPDRSLLTIDELRAAAGATDNSQDATLTILGGYISSMITSACDVAKCGAIPPTLRLESVTQTFRVHGHWDRTSVHNVALILARKPVVSITSVTENDTILDAADFEVDGSLLYRRSGGSRVYWCHGEMLVAYDAGYETVPDDLKYAAIKFVQEEVARGSRDRYLRSRTTPGVLEQSWWVDPTKDSMMPPEVMSILEAGGYVTRWGYMR